MGKFMDEVLDGVRQDANERNQNAYNEGFSKAANISLNELNSYINNIHSNYSKETPLDEYDQHTLIELEKLKKSLASKLGSFN
ncbi:hypothetical protein EFO35_05650 [Lactococcus cremoris]|jgi:hypothetical protein|uniref:hypothetical protein n=1 Tax=Lactococcus lactis subsp. cremoris TaxID=1359 RepID=UPI0021AA6E92|nr:hypothetical protein [Lactococcus cremoris]MCT4454530.1 hypothetical protein [Lactococcus cremoris]MDY5176406.1 hypothetical protein [Lactococcus lactis]